MLRRILHSRRPRVPIEENATTESWDGENCAEEIEDTETRDHKPSLGTNKVQRWKRLEHNGPWFSSFEKDISKEEILSLYHQVPQQYRTATFWRNFADLCITEGWFGFVPGVDFITKHAKTPSVDFKLMRTQFERYSPSVAIFSPPRTDTVPPSYKKCYIVPETPREEQRGYTEEPITYWKMEPPTVFIGRGNHPLRGCLRKRVLPEDVTLNLDRNAPIPALPKGRRWKDVVNKPECSWLWSWEDKLLGKMKYVYPASVSMAHAEAERRKFDEAAELGRHVSKIRKFYTDSFERGVFLELSCVLYLIDNLGIRIGNDNNPSVDGATTLRVENVRPLDGHRAVWIRFIGKDSIEYNNKIVCSSGFVEAIKKLSEGKGPVDFLFPNINARIVNSYLQSYSPNLSAKTFRTFNATQRFANSVREYSPRHGDPVVWFKKCVMEVAVFCNHKRISTLRKRQEQYSPVTSITNYIDPRVVVSWARSTNVPLGKIYSRTLMDRFSWAME
jgi:hypothetical protein